MPIPRDIPDPLPFAGLRRLLDYLLWREIEVAARHAPTLPDVQVVHPLPCQNPPTHGSSGRWERGTSLRGK